jgi:hypothetical protein
MDIERFWQLIESARAAAGPQADQAVRDFDLTDDGTEVDADGEGWEFDEAEMQALIDAARAEFEAGRDLEVDDLDDSDLDAEDEDDLSDPIAVALHDLLVQLPAAEIGAFDNLFEDVRALADRAGLANAAILIEHGFLGDDSFDDFRAGLVALGRRAFEAAIADPDSLADHPLVREIATARDPRWLGREDMLFVASHAYADVTGEDEVTFYDFAESLRGPDFSPVVAEPDVEWEITDEAETRRRLPKLSSMFYERSMRNRRRALDKLGL